MRRRKLAPGTRHHEYWCAIFNGKPCDCDDDRRPPRGWHRPLAGGGAPVKREKELEDA
jgi:hypothetical protein